MGYGSYKLQILRGEDGSPLKISSVHTMDLTRKIETQTARDITLNKDRLTNFLLGFYDLLFFKDDLVKNEVYLCQPFEGDILELLVTFEEKEGITDYKIGVEGISEDKELVPSLDKLEMKYSVIGGYFFKEGKTFSIEDTIDVEREIQGEDVIKYWEEDLRELARIIEYAFVYI